MAIPLAKTRSDRINYVEEHEARGPLAENGDIKEIKFEGPKQVELTVRDWDVTDPEARAVAADEQLGEGAADDDHWRQHAMWFIKAEENKAVLIVFRPKVTVA